MSNRFFYFLKLIKSFVLTEILTGVELIFWKKITFVLFLVIPENDPLNFKPALYLLIVSIPLIMAIYEYENNEQDIKEALRLIKNPR